MIEILQKTLKNTLAVIANKEGRYHLLNESIFRQIFIEELHKITVIPYERFEIEWNKFDLIIKPNIEDDIDAIIEFKYYHHSKSEKYLNGSWFKKGFPSLQNEREFLKDIINLNNPDSLFPKKEKFRDAISKFKRAYIVVACREGANDMSGKKKSYTKSYYDFKPFQDDKRIKDTILVEHPVAVFDSLHGEDFNLFGRVLEINIDNETS